MSAAKLKYRLWGCNVNKCGECVVMAEPEISDDAAVLLLIQDIQRDESPKLNNARTATYISCLVGNEVFMSWVINAPHENRKVL